jgi:competence protein ComEA
MRLCSNHYLKYVRYTHIQVFTISILLIMLEMDCGDFYVERGYTMKTKWQFQNLALQEEMRKCEEFSQQPTAPLSALTLPISQKSLISSFLPITPLPIEEVSLTDLTLKIADAEAASEDYQEEAIPVKATVARKKKLLRGVILALCLLLALALYVVWHTTTPPSASPSITQQNLSNASSSQSTNDNPTSSATTSDTIQVYILGAVKHPGVYTLSPDARVYQLLQKAGGPLPDADLIALNLAAKLTDGQEIYVLHTGEVPPGNLNPSSPGSSSSGTATPGQLVNINTATATEMQQTLHVSAATAQKITNYRTQHGPYTSVSQLLQAISQSIYNRIKNMVTV